MSTAFHQLLESHKKFEEIEKNTKVEEKKVDTTDRNLFEDSLRTKESIGSL
mgnify:CR=1 FL=1